MCKRFALWDPPGTISRYFKVGVPVDFKPRYNIAPGQQILAVRQVPGLPRDAAHFKWGLIPSRTAEESTGSELFNAMAENASTTPEFTEAFKSRRCLIPASGFYAWQPEEAGGQPFLVLPGKTELFAFAGIWEKWSTPRSQTDITSCAILTTGADTLLHPLHQRMPAIIEARDFQDWLDPSVTDEAAVVSLIKPCPGDAVSVQQVSTAVNDIRNDDPSLVEPAE
ncbi:MAG: SOS response-associated peptidase [Desulfosalsimonadaceae bacterium]